MQALKDEIEDLQIDLKKASEEKEALSKEVEAQTKLVSTPHRTLSRNILNSIIQAEEFKAGRAEVVGKFNTMVTNFKNRIANLNEQITTLTKTNSELEAKVAELTAQIEQLKTEAASATASKTTDAATASATAAELESLKSELLIKTQEKEEG